MPPSFDLSLASAREEMAELHAALLDYVERYGLTDRARRVLSWPSRCLVSPDFQTQASGALERVETEDQRPVPYSNDRPCGLHHPRGAWCTPAPTVNVDNGGGGLHVGRSCFNKSMYSSGYARHQSPEEIFGTEASSSGVYRRLHRQLLPKSALRALWYSSTRLRHTWRERRWPRSWTRHWIRV